jgi:hypothetical protein
MNFSTTSFLAGVGTVFAAVALGFAGGATMNTSPKVEPNRLERVTAAPPTTKPDAIAAATTADASVKAGMPEIRSVVAVKAPEEPVAAAKNETKDEMPQSTLVPERVISQTPASASQQAVPPQPAPMTAKPVVARDDTEAQADSAKKARDDQLKRESASRSAERRAERRRERRRRDIEGAEDAVLRVQPDDAPQTTPQHYGQRYEQQRNDRGPRFGFFGDD